MRYKNIVEGVFIERPNRFVAYVDIDGKRTVCHVKNTGRCRELLVPGARVWLEKSDNPSRKTLYDMVAVYKEAHGDIEGQIVNFDSQAPNVVVKEWLQKGNLFDDISFLKPETYYGDSRVDFYLETTSGKRVFIEVKGVTLENDGVASFPDAPTERGIKHIRELQRAACEGYEAIILFVIQMKHIKYMKPDEVIHPEFASTLAEAEANGVRILAYDCLVEKDSLSIDQPVKVII